VIDESLGGHWSRRQHALRLVPQVWQAVILGNQLGAEISVFFRVFVSEMFKRWLVKLRYVFEIANASADLDYIVKLECLGLVGVHEELTEKAMHQAEAVHLMAGPEFVTMSPTTRALTTAIQALPLRGRSSITLRFKSSLTCAKPMTDCQMNSHHATISRPNFLSLISRNVDQTQTTDPRSRLTQRLGRNR